MIRLALALLPVSICKPRASGDDPPQHTPTKLR